MSVLTKWVTLSTGGVDFIIAAVNLGGSANH